MTRKPKRSLSLKMFKAAPDMFSFRSIAFLLDVLQVGVIRLNGLFSQIDKAHTDESSFNPEISTRSAAEGDSMEPLICDGDTVLFVEEPEGSPVRDGHVYALRYGGSLKIKRLYRKANGDLIIRSDNSRYPDEVVPNSLTNELVQIYGPVIERSGTI